MEQNVVQEKKTNVLLQYGLLSAGLSMLSFVILYVLGAESFGSPVAWATMLIPIVCGVLACIKAKKENEGFLEFREALKICFGILVMTSLGSSLLNYVLCNYIDPAFGEALKQLSIEKAQQMMARFNVPQEAIDKEINNLINTNIYSLGNIFKSFAQGCIVFFIVALIMAAIMKKKKPVFGE